MESRAFALASIAASVCFLGCGNGSGQSSDALGSCGVAATTRGAATLTFDGEASCLSQPALETGISVGFLYIERKIGLSLFVDDVTEGETGQDHPARIVLDAEIDGESKEWETDACLASLDEHAALRVEQTELFGELRHHRVRGTGSCSEALQPGTTEAGDAELTLSPFDFVAEIRWRDP